MTFSGKTQGAFAPADSSSPPHHVRLGLPHALVSQGGGQRENVYGTFPDSHLSWVRRKKGGFRPGGIRAGKVCLSYVAWPPGARAGLWGRGEDVAPRRGCWHSCQPLLAQSWGALPSQLWREVRQDGSEPPLPPPGIAQAADLCWEIPQAQGASLCRMARGKGGEQSWEES